MTQYEGWGGAIYFNESRGLVTNCTFTGNSASETGGAIYLDNCSGTRITNCTFSNNSVTPTGKHGGAIGMDKYSATYNDLVIDGCTFTNCEAPQGGAIWAGIVATGRLENPTIDSCTFTDCDATDAEGKGGAIYFDNVAGVVEGCSIADSDAHRGGGIYIEGRGMAIGT